MYQHIYNQDAVSNTVFIYTAGEGII